MDVTCDRTKTCKARVSHSVPFLRQIQVAIDGPSWAAQPPAFRHRLPGALVGATGVRDIHLLLVLLRLGYMTTPLLNLAAPSAAWWPAFRYLHIFTSHRDLRLWSDWADIDFHQKTIASDDLGVGVGITVLQELFQYGWFADGRAFAKRLIQHGVIAAAGGPRKKGAMKTPDFALWLPTGKIHLVECKGSQFGLPRLRTAMNSGVSQKRSLVFHRPAHERAFIGQRMVTGLFVSRENQQSRSTLVIRDPAPSQPLIVGEDVTRDHLFDAVLRGDFARMLMAAGLTNTALRFGYFDLPSKAPPPRGEAQRARLATAIENDRPSLEAWQDDGGSYVDRVANVPLFNTLSFEGQLYDRAILRFGVGKHLLDDLSRTTSESPYVQRAYQRLVFDARDISTSYDGSMAEFRRGRMFTAHLELRARG
jgi:hypothetical protein